MALTKRTYTDFDYNIPITADNLNAIQDEIISNGEYIEALQEGAIGVGGTTIWDNSNSMINVRPAHNGISSLVQCTATDYPADLPSELQGVTANLIRHQHSIYLGSNASLWAVVVLYELYPTKNRMWVRTYNTNSSGWSAWTQYAPEAHWIYYGYLLVDGSSSFAGYGKANIYRQANGIYKVEWSAQITTAKGSSETEGMSRVSSEVFASTVGKTITPIARYGWWDCVNSSGTARRDRIGYGGNYDSRTSPTGWGLSRVYGTSSSQQSGGWGAGSFAVGDFLHGVCYGT